MIVVISSLVKSLVWLVNSPCVINYNVIPGWINDGLLNMGGTLQIVIINDT